MPIANSRPASMARALQSSFRVQHRACSATPPIRAACNPLLHAAGRAAFFDSEGQMSSLKRRLVVIGNGMVGQRLLENLAARSTEYSITVLGEEPRAAYD